MIPDQILNEIIEEIAGSDVLPLVQILKGKVNVSEFKMAEKLEVTVNHVRNMLYRLSAHDVMDWTRKKDKEKGWYVYFWTLNMLKLRDLTVKIKIDRVEKLELRLKNEQSTDYFRCPDKHIRASLTSAMEQEFKCPECGLHLEREDNKKTIETIQRTITRLNEEINLLRSLEILPIKEKRVTKKIKKIKAKPKTKPASKKHKTKKKAPKRKKKK